MLIEVSDVAGPACDSLCTPMSQTMEIVNKLMISYGCVSPALIFTVNYLGTVASFSDLGPLLKDVLDKFKWTRLAILYEWDDVWHVTAQNLQVLMASCRFKVNIDNDSCSVTFSMVTLFTCLYRPTLRGQVPMTS
jgi:hypothetical protein